MKHVFCFLIAFIALSCSNLFSQESLQDAENAFYDLNLAKANELYLNIYNNSKESTRDRVEAGRMLAYISNHFYDDITKAENYVLKSLEQGENQAYLYRDLIGYFADKGNYEKSYAIYNQAVLDCKSDKNLHVIYTAFARAVLDEAGSDILNSNPLNNEVIHDAFEKSQMVNQIEAGDLSSAKIQLGLALILKDGKKALEAWNMYYHIPKNSKAKELIKKPQEKLIELLGNWDGEDIAKGTKEQLIVNLAASRFYDFAFFMIKHLNVGNANDIVKDISAYQKYCGNIESCAFEYYKTIAVDHTNEAKAFKKKIQSIQKELWDELTWLNRKPRYTDDRFRQEIYQRFGTRLYVGEFNGSEFYIGGHSIIDTIKTVQQFGHKARIQYVVLDHRFSNNYWGWFTSYMGFAGYANGEIIVKYREPASSNPIFYWNRMKDEKSIKIWECEIQGQLLRDDSLMKSNTYSFFRGVHNNIRLKEYKKIIDSLKMRGVKDHELRMSFIAVLNDVVNTGNINHEGRHAIDFNVLPRTRLNNDIDLEYRAYLSQIYFSDYPHLDIGLNIDNTPHGQARKKIIEELSDWMKTHKDEIKDLNSDKSFIAQIDLLSRSQIRQFVKSVEPFLK